MQQAATQHSTAVCMVVLFSDVFHSQDSDQSGTAETENTSKVIVGKDGRERGRDKGKFKNGITEFKWNH